MDEQIPWYGGISNRQILVDTVKAIAIWLAVFVPVFALLWWLSGFSAFASIRPHVGAITVATALLVSGIIRWRRRAY